MSITQNAKRAMEQAGIATSEGTEWTTEDQRNFIDFLYFNHGIGREKAQYVLVHADDQKEPLRSQLLEGIEAPEAAAEDVKTAVAEEGNDAGEPEVPPADLEPEGTENAPTAEGAGEQEQPQEGEQEQPEQPQEGEGQEQPAEAAEGGDEATEDGAPKEFQL